MTSLEVYAYNCPFELKLIDKWTSCITMIVYQYNLCMLNCSSTLPLFSNLGDFTGKSNLPLNIINRLMMGSSLFFYCERSHR